LENKDKELHLLLMNIIVDTIDFSLLGMQGGKEES
jgi:hypothetical protein